MYFYLFQAEVDLAFVTSALYTPVILLASSLYPFLLHLVRSKHYMSRLVSLLSCLIFCQSWCFIFYYFYSAVFMIFTLSFLCVSLPVLLGTVTLKANFMILPFQFSVNFMFFSLVVPSDLVTSVAVSTSVFAFFSVCSILNILFQHHIITTYSPLTVHFPHNSLSAVFSTFFPHTTLSPLAVQCLHHYITYSSITTTSV